MSENECAVVRPWRHLTVFHNHKCKMDQHLCDNSAPEGYTTIMLEEWMKKDPKKNKLLLVQVAMLFIIGKLKKFGAKCWKDCVCKCVTMDEGMTCGTIVCGRRSVLI